MKGRDGSSARDSYWCRSTEIRKVADKLSSGKDGADKSNNAKSGSEEASNAEGVQLSLIIQRTG